MVSSPVLPDGSDKMLSRLERSMIADPMADNSGQFRERGKRLVHGSKIVSAFVTEVLCWRCKCQRSS